MTTFRPEDEATIRDAHKVIAKILDGPPGDEEEREIERQRTRVVRAAFDSLGLR